MEALVLVGFAYLLGSVPTGYALGKLAGVDVRTVGSGNVGATNVARAVGKGQGVLTVIADSAKGFVPVAIALKWGMQPAALATVASAAFLGHPYPAFLKFRGGNGVATAFGALF